MILISHRGNFNEINKQLENTVNYIDIAICKGYSVEIDIRFLNGKLWLGHDSAENMIDIGWIIDRKEKLFVHSKNANALRIMMDNGIKTFYHTIEDQVIVANSDYIWTHDINNILKNSIIPLISLEDIKKYQILEKIFKEKNVAGICSDYINYINPDI